MIAIMKTLTHYRQNAPISEGIEYLNDLSHDFHDRFGGNSVLVIKGESDI
jgi:hypothetical protein